MDIVRKDGLVSAIFFPPGSVIDGGTCQFATKECLYNCYAEKSALVKEIYKFITEEEIFKVCSKIRDDFSRLGGEVLHWFSAGDCESKHQERLLKIMRYLSKEDVVQCGFTRNKSLYSKANKIRNMNMIFTVETFDEIKKQKIIGKVAVPNYETGYINIYLTKPSEIKEGFRSLGTCGGTWYEYKVKGKTELITEADCNYCFKNRLGCFYNTEEKAC